MDYTGETIKFKEGSRIVKNEESDPILLQCSELQNVLPLKVSQIKNAISVRGPRLTPPAQLNKCAKLNKLLPWNVSHFNSVQPDRSPKFVQANKCDIYVIDIEQSDTKPVKYSPYDMIKSYVNYCDQFNKNNKSISTVYPVIIKCEEDVPNPKGCFPMNYRELEISAARKLNAAKKAANNRAKKVYKRSKAAYTNNKVRLLLVKAYIGIILHLADIGTDGKTAWEHYKYNHPGYAVLTIILIVGPMALSSLSIIVIMIIRHDEWSRTCKCLMVLLCMVFFPAVNVTLQIITVIAIHNGQDPEGNGPAALWTGVLKCLEAICESLPQTAMQLGFVFQSLVTGGMVPPIVWVSITVSVMSLMFTLVTNDAFSAAATSSKVVIGVVGLLTVPTRVIILFLCGRVSLLGFFSCIGLFLTYVVITCIRIWFGGSFKWTLRRDQKGYDSYGTIRSSNVDCIGFSLLFVLFDSFSLAGLPCSYITLVLAILYYPYGWHSPFDPYVYVGLPKHLAAVPIAMAATSFILNIVMTTVPKLRHVGEDFCKLVDDPRFFRC